MRSVGASDLLTHKPLFSGLDRLTLAKLAAHVAPIPVPVGEPLFHDGDPADGLHLGNRGRLGVYGRAASGSNQVRLATRSSLRDTSHLHRLRLQTWLFGPWVHRDLDQRVDRSALVAERAPVKRNEDRSWQYFIRDAHSVPRLASSGREELCLVVLLEAQPGSIRRVDCYVRRRATLQQLRHVSCASHGVPLVALAARHEGNQMWRRVHWLTPGWDVKPSPSVVRRESAIGIGGSPRR